MFVLCPHCQFLVALLANGVPPERCPRCDGSLQPQGLAPRDDGDEVSGATPAGGNDAAADSGGEGAAAPMPVEAEAADAASPADADGPAHVAAADAIAEAMPGPAAIAVAPAQASRTGARAARSPDSGGSGTPSAATATAIAEPVAVAAESSAPVHAEAVPAANAADAAAAETPMPARASARKTRRAQAVPSFARAAPRARPMDKRRFWLESAAISALSLLLAMQWLLADRARLAADARWRPLLSTLCGVFGCALPPWREPHAYTLLERDVRPHPQRAGVLRVTATFRNDARWPQPWPGLLLTLSDLDGRVAGARVFTAREYLGAAPTQNGLDRGQTATISMDVVEPTPRIVAFTFDFR